MEARKRKQITKKSLKTYIENVAVISLISFALGMALGLFIFGIYVVGTGVLVWKQIKKPLTLGSN